MPELSLHNIEQISRDIRRQEITFSHLLEDLIDHICCDVEYEMQSSGLDFMAAYKKVKQKFGSRRLKEIQEETLYSVDTKYRHMKNTMKISGIIGTLLLGFAAVFKIQHWPLAGVMLTLGAFMLAFIFMPSALGVLWKETHSRKRLFLFISAFFAGFFFISGTLFKVQHWPGAGLIITLAAVCAVLFFIPALLADSLKNTENKAKKPVYILGAAGIAFYLAGMLFKIMHWPLAAVLMLSGLILLSIIVFPWYTWLTWKEEVSVDARFIYMAIGLLLIVLPGTLVSLNLQQSYENGFFPHLERQQMIYDMKSRQNVLILDKYHDSLTYPQMEQLHMKTAELLSYISDIQVNMVQAAEGEPGNPAVAEEQIAETAFGPAILYGKLSDPFAIHPAEEYLVTGSGSRDDLEKKILEYSQYISGIQDGDDKKSEWTEEASARLAELLPDKDHTSLMSAMHSLELMKNTLLVIESELLYSFTCN